MHARTLLLLGAACLAITLPGCLSVAQQAANGNANAQFRYGRKLLTGRGAEKDPARALIWFKFAAEQGHPKATAAVALCHQRGLGTERNPDLARRWYEKAESLGHVESSYALADMDLAVGRTTHALRRLDTLSELHNLKAEALLANMYMDERFAHYDPAKAVRYLRYAAMDGSAEAAFLMAACYAEGVGVPCSETLALGWLKLAAEGGNKLAIKILKEVSA